MSEIYIQKLKNIYLEKTGQKISDQLALELFNQLIALVEAIYKPIEEQNGRTYKNTNLES